jgi:hypothetical protein
MMLLNAERKIREMTEFMKDQIFAQTTQTNKRFMLLFLSSFEHTIDNHFLCYFFHFFVHFSPSYPRSFFRINSRNDFYRRAKKY